jgi:DDE family transposase
LVEGQAEALLLDTLLEVCKQRGWLKAGGKQRTDSTHVLARARSLSNLECVGETLRAALNDLARQAPEWLARQVSLQWVQRYGHRVENYRLPKADTQRTALAEQIGMDGLHLLRVLEQPDTPAGLRELSSVRVLRTVWQQYYQFRDGRASWPGGPQAEQDEGVVRSPYDAQARTGKKRELVWLGYRVHMTETCDAPTPEVPHPLHLVIQVQTTVANVQDVEQTASIQQGLAQAELLPSEQLVDTGYVDADLLVSSQQTYGIRLLGPVLSDNSWQAKADKGFDAAHFQIDWQQQTATCPQGEHSSRWTPIQDPERVEVVFARTTCAACPCRADCTRSQTSGRVLHLRPQEAQEALLARRQEQETPAFRQLYAMRAGIEGTLSQGVRGMGLRQARYLGLQKTHLQHTLTAVAINVVRIDAFLTDTPQGQTRRSAFSALASHPALERPAA